MVMNFIHLTLISCIPKNYISRIMVSHSKSVNIRSFKESISIIWNMKKLFPNQTFKKTKKKLDKHV